MPAYYFAIEGHHAGEKPDPASDTLIAIQYQKIDLTTGEPLGALAILKAWESSEKEIVTTFYHQFFRQDLPVTHFIPVGMNLDYAYEMIIAKCRKYNLPAITSHQLYYQRPRFDLGSVIILLNDGRFTGAGLDTFSSKKSDAGRINKWYESNDFRKIEHALREEAETFLRLLQYLSRYKTRLGIARKGASPPRKPSHPTPPSRTEKELPPYTESPVPSGGTTKKRAGAGTPAPRGSSVQLAKAEPSSRRSPAETPPAGQRSSMPISQFRKHTPTKSTAGKKYAGKRG
jgi:hypothetical protein